MSERTIAITAGGTGGHLFPAFALAEELKRRGYVVDLITDARADQYCIDFPGRSVAYVPSATLRGRSPAAVIKLLATLVKGIWRAKSLINESKPAVMVGFGGYPTVPPLIAARLAAVPVIIHDANAVMGRANRFLAGLASVIALSFAKTRHIRAGHESKSQLVGMPVRDSVLAARKRYRGRSASDMFSVLIFGGSQGARIFADVVPQALTRLPQAVRARLKLVQQVREEDMERVRAIYGEARIPAELETFYTDLPDRMADAQLVIARSGAGTVAELTVLGRPAILVPLPHAIDNDQLENATRLQEAGAAWCIEQSVFTPDRLCAEIARLAHEPEALGAAAKAAESLGAPDAVAKLADIVEDLAQNRAGELS